MQVDEESNAAAAAEREALRAMWHSSPYSDQGAPAEAAAAAAVSSLIDNAAQVCGCVCKGVCACVNAVEVTRCVAHYSPSTDMLRLLDAM